MKIATVRQPKVQVRLLKNVSRKTLVDGVPASERYSGRAASVDLAPYLGERGVVQVSKSVRGAAGSFSVTLTDMISPDAQDTLYGVIEPMDVVEIRMVSDAYLIAKNKAEGASEGVSFPVMMRGFVSEVTRSESIGPDGKPSRTVTISGQDYGKIWQIFQKVFFPFDSADQVALLSTLPMVASNSIGDKPMTAAQFVQKVIDNMLNKYLTGMKGDSSTSPILTLKSDLSVTDGALEPFSVGNAFTGSAYALLMQNCDVGPWNELFIEDRDEAPYVVYRPNPFKAAGSNVYIREQTVDPAIIDVDGSDLVAMQVSRSDADVANYYWVDAPRYAQNRPDAMRMVSYVGDPATLFVTEYGNVDPNLYGIRKMAEQSQQSNPADLKSGQGQPSSPERDRDNLTAVQWLTERRQDLIDQNRDNVVFEQGTMRLKGNHKIRAGCYVRVTRGKITAEYYAVAVTHQIMPFGSYITTVQFERGTGFIERAKMAAPGYAERVSTDAK